MERINTGPPGSVWSGWVQPTLLVVWRFGGVGRKMRESWSLWVSWDFWWLHCWEVRSWTPWNRSLAFSVVDTEKGSVCVCLPAQVRAFRPWWVTSVAKAATHRGLLLHSKALGQMICQSLVWWRRAGTTPSHCGNKTEKFCSFLFLGQSFYNLCKLSLAGLYTFLGLYLLHDSLLY